MSASSSVRWAVPRIVRNHLTKRLKAMSYQQSPNDLLSRFPEASRLTVKQSSTNRFFMYEEHAPNKLQNDDDPMTPTITALPMELANLLSESSSCNNDDSQQHPYYYYWTSPISSVAPNLLTEEFDWYQQLHHDENDTPDPSIHQRLDPRGPSLWMGTSNSGTQCHYDVANNMILQLYGTKRIRCFAPHVGVSHLHVFPDAHPKARKSQVDLDTLLDGGTSTVTIDDAASDAESIVAQQQARYPHFHPLPTPFLDVTLEPGDAIEIPAFWFHHVENGLKDNQQQKPSVSLNSFVLSEPMMIANQIFQKASHPMMRRGPNVTSEQVPSILRALGVTLMTSLGLAKDQVDAVEFIQRNLLQARYVPLLLELPKDATPVESIESTIELPKDTSTTETVSITEEQQQAIRQCIDSIRSDFEDLVMEGVDDFNDSVEDNGIVLLVALHLLELWAVQMVGAQAVHEVWRKALLL